MHTAAWIGAAITAAAEVSALALWTTGHRRHRTAPNCRWLVQQVALAVAVDAGLQERGCDNTLRAAQHWAEGAGVDWPRLRVELQGNGGYCDCEILFNIFPSSEFEPD